MHDYKLLIFWANSFYCIAVTTQKFGKKTDQNFVKIFTKSIIKSVSGIGDVIISSVICSYQVILFFFAARNILMSCSLAALT